MTRLSSRARLMPASPIRRLVPLADRAKARGVHVHPLNIGQPDVEIPKPFSEAYHRYDDKVLACGHPHAPMVARLCAFVACTSLLLLAACSNSGDPICSTCMREKCAELISTCETDPGCKCMTECVGESGIPGVDTCLANCTLDRRPSNFAQVEECTAVACPDAEDECATPSDWVRPEGLMSCDHTGSGAIGEGALADCGFDPQLAFDPKGTVLQLLSADGTVCARVERRDEGAGNLANTSWSLVSLQVGPLGSVARIESGAEACWYSSHHNFRDWVHAWTGSRHFDLAFRADLSGGETIYELFAYEAGPVSASSCAPDADGQMCIEGPIRLLPFRP